MQLTSFIVILTVILTGCSSTSSRLISGLQGDQSLDVSQNQLTEKRFKELDTILASNLKSRNLSRAKSLIVGLKSTVTDDHARQKELTIAAQWVNESLGHQANIEQLEKQTRRLRAEISKYKEALKQVRRTLVSE